MVMGWLLTPAVLPWAAVLLCSIAAAQQAPVFHDAAAPLERHMAGRSLAHDARGKGSQLMNDSPAIDRLGFPAYNWWNECLHGVARAGRATVFPEPSGSRPPGMTTCILRVATAISDEARAKHQNSSAAGSATSIRGSRSGRPTSTSSATRAGDAAWRPTAKIPSSPAAWPSQFIRGLQGDDPKYLKTIATAKHYAVHSGPESLRHTFDAVIDDGTSRNVPAAVRDGHSRRRRRLGDVRLQPRRWPACLRQSATLHESSANSGASAATWCPTAARSATSTSITRRA